MRFSSLGNSYTAGRRSGSGSWARWTMRRSASTSDTTAGMRPSGVALPPRLPAHRQAQALSAAGACSPALARRRIPEGAGKNPESKGSSRLWRSPGTQEIRCRTLRQWRAGAPESSCSKPQIVRDRRPPTRIPWRSKTRSRRGARPLAERRCPQRVPAWGRCASAQNAQHPRPALGIACKQTARDLHEYGVSGQPKRAGTSRSRRGSVARLACERHWLQPRVEEGCGLPAVLGPDQQVHRQRRELCRSAGSRMPRHISKRRVRLAIRA